MSVDAIREQMRRIFGDFAQGVEIYDDEMPLMASGEVPDDVAALVTCMEADEYFNGESLTGTLHQMLYGVWGFEEANGEYGIISEMIESGGLPEGAYEIGEHLLVDTAGAFGEGHPGAVYAVSSDYAIESADPVADSIVEMLEKIEPVAG